MKATVNTPAAVASSSADNYNRTATNIVDVTMAELYDSLPNTTNKDLTNTPRPESNSSNVTSPLGTSQPASSNSKSVVIPSQKSRTSLSNGPVTTADSSPSKPNSTSTKRPSSTVPDSKKTVAVPNRPKSSPPQCNTDDFNKPESSGSKGQNAKTNANNSGGGSTKGSPRRRRNDQGQQSPRKSQNNQNQNQQAQQESTSGRVLVTGYPNFTQPHDLLEVFSQFGTVQIDKCNNWSATLTFSTPEAAQEALAARRLNVYGYFLNVRPYSSKMRSDEGPGNDHRRDFSKTKQKNVIIEPSKIDLSGDFQTQLDRILATIRLNQEDIQKISQLYKDLENAFQSIWPGCKAVPFGSITTGLGIKTSDADCFLSLPPKYRGGGNHVSRARRVLANFPNTFAELLAIPRANTPIVKFYHVPADVSCDLTFKTPLGAQNSRLLAFLLRADRRATPAAVLVKYWAKLHELSGTGRLTNYALTLLLLFYLQQPPAPVLPSVQWLQRDRADDFLVDGWNTGFMNDPARLPPATNTLGVADLLGGFFEFYANFNFEEYVVCPFLGVPIKKEAFANTTALPREFDLYKHNVLNNIVMPIRFQTPFCVQDPFEQCHNVASTITSKLATDIRAYFKFAAAAYESGKSTNHDGFLKTILLEKPKLPRGKRHLEYRINLFPRVINGILDEDWRAVVKSAFLTLFEEMMRIKLEKVEEKPHPESKKEREKYLADITKPLWKRKKYNFLFGTQVIGIVQKQSMITEELINNEEQPISLKFNAILTLCNDPKSGVISIRMVNGDLDAFRDFGKFFISVMQGWFSALLRIHSTSYNKRALDDNAADMENNDSNVTNGSDDDDEGNSKTECTTPDEEKHVVEVKPATTSCDEQPVHGADEDEQPCVNE